jgi:adenylate kinase family enzyme
MRYVVVGTSGVGKSTFGRALAQAANCRYIELDELHWAGNWVERPDSEFSDAVRDAVRGDRWVVDGNYSVVRELVWPRATHIIWLNFSRRIVFSRVLWRTLKRVAVGERLWHGNRESLSRAFLSRESILLWAVTTYKKNQDKYAKLRLSGQFQHLDWQEFTTPSQATRFVENRVPSEHGSA